MATEPGGLGKAFGLPLLHFAQVHNLRINENPLTRAEPCLIHRIEHAVTRADPGIFCASSNGRRL